MQSSTIYTHREVRSQAMSAEPSRGAKTPFCTLSQLIDNHSEMIVRESETESFWVAMADKSISHLRYDDDTVLTIE